MAEQKQTSKHVSPLYVPADFYLLRAPALPAQAFIRMSNTGHISLEGLQKELDETLSRGRQACYQELLALAAQPEIRQALALASPSLQRSMEQLQRREDAPTRQKRTYAGLLRYLIRMSTRPTPFGLFSGVALGVFAEETGTCLGTPAIAHFRTRPDMQWLLKVLQKVEENRKLVTQLKVRLNQTAYLAGERAMLPFSDTYGESDHRAVSLRATAAVHKVFELAQQFIPYTELGTELQQAFPLATGEQIEGLLWQLWEHGFLISQLHPPLTDAQPALYILKHLSGLIGIDEIKRQLSQVLESGKILDQAGIGAEIGLIERLVQNQEAILPEMDKEKLPLQVDGALSMHKRTLHRSIGQAAARAAEILLRQTPQVDGFSQLKEYRALFLEKYGERAEVPLLDLLSPENGLDAPADYQCPPRVSSHPRSLARESSVSRDQLLLGLVTEALNRQSLEIELTDELQQRLERWTPKLAEAPLSLEIYLHLHGHDREAIDRGEWMAMIGRNCGSLNAGRTFGRFFDLLGEPGLEALRTLFEREEKLLPDVIFAELSYQPLQARQANVAIRPPLRSYEIAIGTTPSVPPEKVLLLSDLVVSVQNGRFYLRSLRLGKQVRVCQSHMLNITKAPNVCRFITEIAGDGAPLLSPFDWGAAEHAPFLPRLVMKVDGKAKLVLTPARWYAQAETITPVGSGSEEARWFRGMQQWRQQWRVPRYVYLSQMDNRLLLDLEHPLMAEELRDEVRKLKGHMRVALDELLPDFEHLWLRDGQEREYFSEIVVPLLRRDAVEQAVRTTGEEKPRMSRERVILPPERNRFPGEDWVYLKLYAAPGQHEELIAGSLDAVVRPLQEHELIDRWFFLRYADPEPHLRLRFHAKERSAVQSVLAIVLSWSLHLGKCRQIQRYALDTYEREVERYGGPLAIDLLEQVFTVDSAIVRTLVVAQYGHRLTLDPLAVAVFSLDHFLASWGYNFRQRLEWTHTFTEQYAFSKAYHAARKSYCELFSPRSQLDPAQAEQRALLLELLRLQEALLGDLASQVRQLAEADQLWEPEASLLRSLAHMHVNRLLGSDRNRENQIYAFWRHTLDSLERRSAQDHIRA